MKQAKFFREGEPPHATMQHKGVRVVNGHVYHYTKKRQQEALDYWQSIGTEILERLGGETLTGPVHISVNFLFPHPSGTKKIERTRGAFRTKRPDLDNMVKGLLDGFSKAGVWEDDAQVVSLQLEKLNVPDERVGTDIKIYEYDT